MRRSKLAAEAGKQRWFHGSPVRLPEDLRERRWDRDRSTDQNQEGPGWYWTTSAREALGYAARFDAETDGYVEGCLYEARLAPRARVFDASTPADAASLAAVVRAAPPEEVAGWLENFGHDRATPAAVRQVLTSYARGTLLDGLVMLYHDLFRYDAPLYVASVRTIADACVLDKGEYHGGERRQHLVVYDPAALRDVMTSC